MNIFMSAIRETLKLYWFWVTFPQSYTILSTEFIISSDIYLLLHIVNISFWFRCICTSFTKSLLGVTTSDDVETFLWSSRIAAKDINVDFTRVMWCYWYNAVNSAAQYVSHISVNPRGDHWVEFRPRNQCKMGSGQSSCGVIVTIFISVTSTSHLNKWYYWKAESIFVLSYIFLWA